MAQLSGRRNRLRGVSVRLATIFAVGCSKGGTEARIVRLEQQVELQRAASVEALAAYVPKVKGQIGDIDASTADILRQLPGVADVEVLVAAEEELPPAMKRELRALGLLS